MSRNGRQIMATNQTNKTVGLANFCDIPLEAVIATYVVVMILGILNNILVIVVVWKNKDMQNPTNILLTNNAIAEVINVFVSTTMVIIFTLATRTTVLTWKEKKIVFKALDQLRALYIFPVLITMVTLAIIAVERYNALIHPMNVYRRLNKRVTKRAMYVIWITCIILSLPFSSRHIMDSKLQMKLFYYLFALSSGTVAVTGLVIIFCYGRIIFAIFVTKTVCNQLSQACDAARSQDWKNKKNTVKMLLSITFIFVFTKFPPLIYAFLALSNSDPNFQCSVLLTFFGHISALLNPIVYLVYSSNYRDGTRKLFRSCSCGKRYRVNRNI